MCSIDASEKQKESTVDNFNSGGGNELQSNSTTEALASLGKNLISLIAG